MALEDYRRKRRFARTPEPPGRTARRRTHDLTFVVQKHAASRLHYDFRLELDGVLKSWAVPKGPSLDPADKRLAVAVEDHPLDYGGFEGTIPEGEYGGGTVMLWDRGTWQPDGDPAAGLAKGNLKFTLAGSRLKGAWALVRMGGARNADGKNWLLIKERDAAARPGEGAALIERHDRSVASRRTMDGIAKAKDRVWRSTKRPTAMRARTERLAERARPPSRRHRGGAARGSLPAQPRPELATLAAAAPEGTDWIHEIKFDGYRMLPRIDHGTVTMLSRNGKDWTERFPAITAALAALPVTRRGARRRGRSSPEERHLLVLRAQGRSLGRAHRASRLLRVRSSAPRRPDAGGRGAAARKEALAALVPGCGRAGALQRACHRQRRRSSSPRPARLALEGIVVEARRCALSRRAQPRLAQGEMREARGVRRARLDRSRAASAAAWARCCWAITTGARRCTMPARSARASPRSTLAALRAVARRPGAADAPPRAEAAKAAPRGAHWVGPRSSPRCSIANGPRMAGCAIRPSRACARTRTRPRR